MDRKHGAPWLIASCFMGLQAVVMWFAPGVPLLGTLFLAYSAIPLPVAMLAGLAAGVLAGWLGWRAGGQTRISVKTASAPA